MQVASNPSTIYALEAGFVQTGWELRLDVAPGLDTAVLGPGGDSYTWSDLTGLATDLRIVRGRSRALDRVNAGTLTVQLLDRDRDLDPENTGGPYYGDLEPRRPVRVTADPDGLGPIDLIVAATLPLRYRLRPGGYQTATLTAADQLATIAEASLDQAAARPAETTGARLAWLLATTGAATQADLDTGTVTLPATTLPAGTRVLDYATTLARAESGAFLVAGDGTIVFRDRDAAVNVAPQLTLGPDRASYLLGLEDGGDLLLEDDGDLVQEQTTVQYLDLDVQHGDEVYPVVQVTDQAGTVHTAVDVGARALYGPQAITNTDAILGTADAEQLAEQLLAQYGQPRTTVRTVTVLLDERVPSCDQEVLLALDLGEVVAVQRTYTVGAPATITDWYLVEGIEHDLSRARHLLRLTLGAKTTAGWLQLDDPVFGRLDYNALSL